MTSRAVASYYNKGGLSSAWTLVPCAKARGMCSELKQGREGWGGAALKRADCSCRRRSAVHPHWTAQTASNSRGRTCTSGWLAHMAGAHTHNLKLKRSFKKKKQKQAKSSEAAYGLMNLLRGIWVQDESGGAHMASLVPQEGSSAWTALVREEGRSL